MLHSGKPDDLPVGREATGGSSSIGRSNLSGGNVNQDFVTDSVADVTPLVAANRMARVSMAHSFQVRAGKRIASGVSTWPPETGRRPRQTAV